MPDYTIKVWNTNNFDIDSVSYVRQAYDCRKWAFAADYIRLYALYNEGGIYLDSDVMVHKRFDDFLNHRFFTAMEYHPSQIERDGSMAHIDADGRRIHDVLVSGIQIQAAVMGAVPGVKFLKDAMEWYHSTPFIKPDGSMRTDIISPQIYAHIAEKYGFRYIDADQQLDDGMMVYRSEIFAGNKHERTTASYATHFCAHSWADSSIRKFLNRLLKK